MIDSSLADAVADPRLTPMQKNALTALHRTLDYFQYRSVKIASLSADSGCSRPVAFRALAKLEVLGYIIADPKHKKPKRYRLMPPSITTATSQAA